ncbi:MAG: penicillin-binding transpeptidase domain-containing protein [Deltaproteobacteria bacterium]
MKNRVTILLVFFVVLSIILIGFLVDRMILRRQELMTNRFTDKKFIALMEGLIDEGVFRADGKKIAVDEKMLSEKRLGRETKERVQNSAAFLYEKDGRIYFDSQSVSISSSKKAGNETVVRGGFLDRNGITLVKSLYDKKTGRVQREYVSGMESYPVIGHYNAVFGTRNLEKELDSYLTGATHNPVYGDADDPMIKIKLGDTVVLTIDSAIQAVAYDLMKEKRGAAVVLDVKTGEVLAAVSTPSFDPNTKDGKIWRETFKDKKERRYENRTFQALYPPGSTFKAVVAAAWLEEGSRKNEGKDYSIRCTDKTKNRFDISDIHNHGIAGIDKAFIESCNQFFSEAGVKTGVEVLHYAARFGFNEKVNLVPQLKHAVYNAEASLAFSWREFDGSRERAGAYKAADFRKNPKVIAQCSIGQNLVTATPLQMAMVAGTIANKGVMMNPYLVKEIRTGDGKSMVIEAKPIEKGRIVQRATAEKIANLMESVMITGTGKNVKKVYYENSVFTTAPKGKNTVSIRISGKTGTAEVGDRNGNGSIDADEKPHSWFIGFAPADNPRIAIAVLAENQGLGSLTAAPIAMDVLAEALNRTSRK